MVFPGSIYLYISLCGSLLCLVLPYQVCVLVWVFLRGELSEELWWGQLMWGSDSWGAGVGTGKYVTGKARRPLQWVFLSESLLHATGAQPHWDALRSHTECAQKYPPK